MLQVIFAEFLRIATCQYIIDELKCVGQDTALFVRQPARCIRHDDIIVIYICRFSLADTGKRPASQIVGIKCNFISHQPGEGPFETIIGAKILVDVENRERSVDQFGHSLLS